MAKYLSTRDIADELGCCPDKAREIACEVEGTIKPGQYKIPKIGYEQWKRRKGVSK